MRRELREQLPAFAAVYGLMPWHFDGGDPVLSYGEIEVFAAKIGEAAAYLQLRAETGRG